MSQVTLNYLYTFPRTLLTAVKRRWVITISYARFGSVSTCLTAGCKLAPLTPATVHLIKQIISTIQTLNKGRTISELKSFILNR